MGAPGETRAGPPADRSGGAAAGGKGRGSGARLPRSFFARDTRRVARDLLGKVLVHQDGGVRRAARIVETEAYHGPRDRASHARFGPTPRAAVMFGPPGVAYVYLIYGTSHCVNVVCGAEGFPAAVLVRAAEPLEGCLHSTRGPGNLCRALGIRRERANGLDLCGDVLFLEDAPRPRERVLATPRVNVDHAGQWAARRWRYLLAGSPSVSGPRGAARPRPEGTGAKGRAGGPKGARAVGTRVGTSEGRETAGLPSGRAGRRAPPRPG